MDNLSEWPGVIMAVASLVSALAAALVTVRRGLNADQLAKDEAKAGSGREPASSTLPEPLRPEGLVTTT